MRRVVVTGLGMINSLGLNRGDSFKAIVEGKSEVSEYFYSARCLLWAPQIDGEILVNEIDIDGIETLEAGYYLLEVSEVKDSYVFGKVIEKL